MAWPTSLVLGLVLPATPPCTPRSGVARMQLEDVFKDAAESLKDVGESVSKATRGVGEFMETFGVGANLGLSPEESKAMEERMRSGNMSLDDFLKQVKVMQKAGSLQQFISKAPFGGGGLSSEQLAEGEKKLSRYAKYVEVIPAEARADPSALIAEAKALRTGGGPADGLKQVAEDAGTSVEQVAIRRDRGPCVVYELSAAFIAAQHLQSVILRSRCSSPSLPRCVAQLCASPTARTRLASASRWRPSRRRCRGRSTARSDARRSGRGAAPCGGAAAAAGSGSVIYDEAGIDSRRRAGTRKLPARRA